MKYKLKPNEKKDIELFINNNNVVNMLKDIESWNFQLGDVLVKYKIDLDGNKDNELVSESCPVPTKYRVVHITNIGPLSIPWVKRISVRGGLGNKIYCLINYSNCWTKWEVDPEQVESIILGSKYDPRREYKDMRSGNPNYGG